MAILSVLEFGCRADILSLDSELKKRLEDDWFPDADARVELSYDSECNTLVIKIGVTDIDADTDIKITFPPSLMLSNFLATIVDAHELMGRKPRTKNAED